MVVVVVVSDKVDARYSSASRLSRLTSVQLVHAELVDDPEHCHISITGRRPYELVDRELASRGRVAGSALCLARPGDWFRMLQVKSKYSKAREQAEGILR